MIDPFNKQMLLQEMPKLLPMARVAFTGSCASRLFPTYEVIYEKEGSGNPSKLKEALDYCWESVLTDATNEIECKAQLQVVEDLIEDAYTSKSAFREYSQDATAIVFYSLLALSSRRMEEPIWAVQCVYESVGRYIATEERWLLKGKQGLKGKKLASKLNNSPLMQQEFARELRDIKELCNDYSTETAQLVKRRAEAEPSLPVELPDTSNLPSARLIQIMNLRDNEFCV